MLKRTFFRTALIVLILMVNIPPIANLSAETWKMLDFQTIDKGWDSGHNAREYYVIQDADEWANVWNLHKKVRILPPPSPPPPEIDFSTTTIIAVFRGACPSKGYGIEIKTIMDNGSVVLVEVEWQDPPPEAAVFPIVTYPYHIVKTDKITKPVIFIGPPHNIIINFKHNTLNLESQGKWITVCIELSEAYRMSKYAITDINISTITVNRTLLPIEYDSIGDFDNDGIQDLTININRTAFKEFILFKGVIFGELTLTITGKMADKTPFYGNTVIKISPLRGDVNCDGIVDIFDITQAAASYDAKDGELRWNPNANFAAPFDTIDIFDLVTIALHYENIYITLCCHFH